MSAATVETKERRPIFTISRIGESLLVARLLAAIAVVGELGHENFDIVPDPSHIPAGLPTGKWLCHFLVFPKE
ncbi:hypothetical protein [Kineosporia succinea]|uniref:Uncharacterized protein n=1 Tax=Kineosporia succinea TaxID=84632 RepID=A0ABT9NXX7_9ACTN|nr:hypothetical protein [Kineosporia succinea]MDP9825265.1 hypothetical protein [Kineosporia succinea]